MKKEKSALTMQLGIKHLQLLEAISYYTNSKSNVNTVRVLIEERAKTLNDKNVKAILESLSKIDPKKERKFNYGFTPEPENTVFETRQLPKTNRALPTPKPIAESRRPPLPTTSSRPEPPTTSSKPIKLATDEQIEEFKRNWIRFLSKFKKPS